MTDWSRKCSHGEWIPLGSLSLVSITPWNYKWKHTMYSTHTCTCPGGNVYVYWIWDAACTCTCNEETVQHQYSVFFVYCQTVCKMHSKSELEFTRGPAMLIGQSHRLCGIDPHCVAITLHMLRGIRKMQCVDLPPEQNCFGHWLKFGWQEFEIWEMGIKRAVLRLRNGPLLRQYL